MNTEHIQKHYTIDDLPERFERALQEAGLGSREIVWSDLAPLDQFHVRGLVATKDLAEALHVTPGNSVLDVGCGFGGPARYLAATRGCHVTGIDLTPAYIKIAEMLSRRTGLADKMTFVQGNALELPFSPESFDHAWTQHVAMNISDKAALYQGISRVLKPGGRLAIYDAVLGNGEPVHYPVPWASQPNMSFLATPEAMSQMLRTSGFRELSANDKTQESLAWFAGLKVPAPGDANGSNLAAILGAEGGGTQAIANFARNLSEGRVRLLQLIVQKD